MTLANHITRKKIVDLARGWTDTPYQHQASVKGQATDCLGLVRGIWRDLYGAEPEELPPYTPDWVERRGNDPLFHAAHRHLVVCTDGPVLPGQVLLFRVARRGPAKHLGIATGTDRFIHAYAGRSVGESWLAHWWTDRLVGQFDFPGVTD